LQDAGREDRIRVHGVGPGHRHPLSLVLHPPVLEPHLQQEQDTYDQKAYVPRLDDRGSIRNISRDFFFVTTTRPALRSTRLMALPPG
jgi:hypothetical protein